MPRRASREEGISRRNGAGAELEEGMWARGLPRKTGRLMRVRGRERAASRPHQWDGGVGGEVSGIVEDTEALEWTWHALNIIVPSDQRRTIPVHSFFIVHLPHSPAPAMPATTIARDSQDAEADAPSLSLCASSVCFNYRILTKCTTVALIYNAIQLNPAARNTSSCTHRVQLSRPCDHKNVRENVE